MATTKPTKPTDLMPRHFADNGMKNNFSSAKISNGFSSNFEDILQGDNLNYMIDSIGKELQYLSTVVDFIVDMPINKTFKVNANNNLEYVNLVEDASNKANVGLDNLNTSGNNKVLPSQTGNGGKFLTTNGTSPSWTSVDIANRSLSNLTSAGEAKLAEGKRNIGEIITSTLPLTDAGLHLLDGANIESGSYANFVSYIADLYNSGDYPDLFTSESDWQSTVAQYGVCGKFVYNSTNNTVRLPKITGIIEGTTDITALGDLVEAGLPNITGTTSMTTGGSTGAFYPAGLPGHGSQEYHGDFSHVGFDASLSNPIYGNSTTVQPQSIKVLCYIVVATSNKTDIQVDIDEIATDLNGKADTDLLNVPESRGILVEKSSKDILPRWYRVYADGWCEQGGYITSSDNETKTITFMKLFNNTNYSISLTQKWDSVNYNANANVQTTSTASMTITGQASGVYWQAYGYIR